MESGAVGEQTDVLREQLSNGVSEPAVVMEQPTTHGGTALPATPLPNIQQPTPAGAPAPFSTRSQSTYMHANRCSRPPATREQSLQNHHVGAGSGQHGAEGSMSASMAVSHLRRTRSDHVMSSRSSRESNSLSRADSPRRTGDDVYDLLANMKKRITDNLLGLGSPFGRRRERRPSDKDGGEGSTPSPSSPARTAAGGRSDTNGDSPDLEGFEFVENIELNHMDGFVVGGKKEAGRGHCFQPIQLAAPTWCDQCGDFIWGVYKQCLKCKCAFTASPAPRYSRAAPRGSFTALEEEDPHGCGGSWHRQEEEGRSCSPGAHYQSGGTASCSDQPHRGRLWRRHREVAVIEVVQEEEYHPAPQVTAKNTNRRTNTEGVGGHRNQPVYTAPDKSHTYSHQHGIRHPLQPQHRQQGQLTEQLLQICEQSASSMADPASTGGTPKVAPKDTSSTGLLSSDGESPTRLVSPDSGSSTRLLPPDDGSTTKLPSSSSDKYLARSESEDVFPESDADVEERLARFRELKARLGSPAESAESVASGQFDDVDSESLPGVGAGGTAAVAAGAGWGTRSRTVSSGSDQQPPVHSPLQDLVIPLPDSSDVMWARYSSSDNLRDSPIPLPDVTGFLSPPVCTDKCRVSTTGTGAHSYSDRSSAALLHQQAAHTASPAHRPASPLATAASADSTADKDDGSTNVGNTAPASVGMSTGRAYPSPLSREPYTPGSYLANRDKYYGRGGGDASHASSAASSATSETSEYKTYFSSSGSERREGAGAKRPYYGMDPSTADDAASIVRNVPRTEPGAAHLLNLNNKRETASTMYASSSDLRESLLRESLSKESTVRDSQSRDSLVREVLARDAKEKDMKDRPVDIRRVEGGGWEQQVPVDVLLDKGRLSAIRDSLNTEFSGGYSLRDYKNYVAKNYGEDEAARIRDRTPQPFTATPTTSYSVTPVLGREEGPNYQPYCVSEDATSVSSDQDYLGGDYLGGSRRGEWDSSRDYDRSYVTRGGTAANQNTSRGYTSRGYEQQQQPRRAESITSDRSYASSTYSSAAPRSSDNESSSSGEQYGGRSSSQFGEQGSGQRQYQRSYSGGDSGRSAAYRRQQQQQQERDSGSRGNRRRSLFDTVLPGSLFNRDGIMDLLDDLFDNKPDKHDLWQRHSGLLRDDDFCRDFFTRDWDWPSAAPSNLFSDEDFFKDRGRNRRSSKSTRTEMEETREEQGDGSGHVRRVRRTQSMESDLGGRSETAEPASSRQGAAGGNRSSSQSSSSSSQSSSQQQRQHYNRNGAPRDSHPTSASSVLTEPKFKGGSFGSFNEEEEARFKESGDGRQAPTRGRGSGESTPQGYSEGRGDNTAKAHARGEGRGEKVKGHGRGQGRSDRNNGTGEDRKDENDDFWDKDTLFFKDYDDLIHRFRDLKWKSAMDSYKSNEKSGKKSQEPPSATPE